MTVMRLLMVLGLAAMAIGCSSSSPSARALATVLQAPANGVAQTIASGRLNPAYAYLHLTVPGQPPALLVLGYVDPSPAGQLMSWYSANNEVLQTLDGLLLSAHGLSNGITGVRFAPNMPPLWPATGAASTSQRTWDAPSQHRYGLQQTWTLQPAQADALPQAVRSHLQRHLGNPDTSAWRWYAASASTYPTAWFARTAVHGAEQTVYSYQCLEPSFCMHMAPWPVAGVVAR